MDFARPAALEQSVPMVVYTTCSSHPDDLPQFEQLERLVRHQGGRMLPVFLSCRLEALQQRVGADDRVRRRKVTTVEGLARCFTRWNLVAVPRENCLTVDSEQTSPEASASLIVRHFGL